MKFLALLDLSTDLFNRNKTFKKAFNSDVFKSLSNKEESKIEGNVKSIKLETKKFNETTTKELMIKENSKLLTKIDVNLITERLDKSEILNEEYE